MPINEVYIFTYDDYLAIMHLRGLYCVAEEKEEYKLETNPEDGTEYVDGGIFSVLNELEKFNNIENFTDEVFNNDDGTWFEYVSFEWT